MLQCKIVSAENWAESAVLQVRALSREQKGAKLSAQPARLEPLSPH